MIESWWFLIPAVVCSSHFCFSLERIKESAIRSCFFRLWMSARLAHLATRWRCSHKEVWSQLHSLAVALRKFSKAGIGRRVAFVSLASLECRAFWILLHVLYFWDAAERGEDYLVRMWCFLCLCCCKIHTHTRACTHTRAHTHTHAHHTQSKISWRLVLVREWKVKGNITLP